jgi:hypothetical protein
LLCRNNSNFLKHAELGTEETHGTISDLESAEIFQQETAVRSDLILEPTALPEDIKPVKRYFIHSSWTNLPPAHDKNINF